MTLQICAAGHVVKQLPNLHVDMFSACHTEKCKFDKSDPFTRAFNPITGDCLWLCMLSNHVFMLCRTHTAGLLTDGSSVVKTVPSERVQVLTVGWTIRIGNTGFPFVFQRYFN
jgi:hypothetical protein